MFVTASHRPVPTAPARPVTGHRPVISVIGMGPEGLVTVAALADLGHRVIAVDMDPDRLAMLMPDADLQDLTEPGLALLLRQGVASGRITACDDMMEGVLSSDVTIVTGGCGQDAFGAPDSYALTATGRALGRMLALKDGFHVVLQQAPVAPGTTRGVLIAAMEDGSGLEAGRDFGVCHWPVRLRAGRALADFRAPSQAVLGVGDRRTAIRIGAILSQLDVTPVLTSIEVAEMAGGLPGHPPVCGGDAAFPMLDALVQLRRA